MRNIFKKNPKYKTKVIIKAGLLKKCELNV